MNKPIFLDRDGVINMEPSNFGFDYIIDIKHFSFLPKVFEAMKLLIAKDYDIYIISNQAGVNKGVYRKETLDAITQWMLEKLAADGIHIKGIRYCIHRSDENCSCRKPKILFLEEFYDGYKGLKKEELFYIGDQGRDIEMAANFGIKSILVLGGKTAFTSLFSLCPRPDFVVLDLYDAVKNVILK